MGTGAGSPSHPLALGPWASLGTLFPHLWPGGSHSSASSIQRLAQGKCSITVGSRHLVAPGSVREPASCRLTSAQGGTQPLKTGLVQAAPQVGPGRASWYSSPVLRDDQPPWTVGSKGNCPLSANVAGKWGALVGAVSGFSVSRAKH